MLARDETRFHRGWSKVRIGVPHVYRRNAVERSICTAKNHLITGLCLYLCDTRYPAKDWDCFIPQAQTTLNLLWSSRRNRSLLVYAAVWRKFEFSSTPLAPPDTKTLAHLKQKKSGSFQVHGINEWYIGPSMKHYRCFKCWIPETGGTRDTDTVESPPNEYPFLQSCPTPILDKQRLVYLAF